MKYIEKLLNRAEVKWMPLGEVAELKRGTTITKKTSAEGKYPVIFVSLKDLRANTWEGTFEK